MKELLLEHIELITSLITIGAMLVYTVLVFNFGRQVAGFFHKQEKACLRDKLIEQYSLHNMFKDQCEKYDNYITNIDCFIKHTDGDIKKQWEEFKKNTKI